jgi:hypothetical protein
VNCHHRRAGCYFRLVVHCLQNFEELNWA